MARRPPPRYPVMRDAKPRGRSGWATFGALIIVGGLAAAALASQGIITIPGLNGVHLPTVSNPFSAPTPAISPNGAPPNQFVAYQDPHARFALYISTTWQAQNTTLTLGSQPQPATTFVPKASALPSWTIALTPTAITADQLIQAINAALTTQGGSDFTPTSGPTAVSVGSYQWSRLDGTVQIKGEPLRFSSFTRASGSGGVIVIAQSIALNYTTTEQQDFTPMLASLALNTADT